MTGQSRIALFGWDHPINLDSPISHYLPGQSYIILLACTIQYHTTSLDIPISLYLPGQSGQILHYKPISHYLLGQSNITLFAWTVQYHTIGLDSPISYQLPGQSNITLFAWTVRANIRLQARVFQDHPGKYQVQAIITQAIHIQLECSVLYIQFCLFLPNFCPKSKVRMLYCGGGH